MFAQLTWGVNCTAYLLFCLSILPSLSYVTSIVNSEGIYSYPTVFFVSEIVYIIVVLSRALSILKAPNPEIVVTSCEYITSSVFFIFPSMWNSTLLSPSLSLFILFKSNAINGLFIIFKSIVK